MRDDGIEVHASLAGHVAGLRAATTDLVLVLPVDCPLLEATDLRALAAACRDAAIPQTGPLPGAYRAQRPARARARARGRSAEGSARCSPASTSPSSSSPLERLVNVNTPAELEALEAGTGGVGLDGSPDERRTTWQVGSLGGEAAGSARRSRRDRLASLSVVLGHILLGVLILLVGLLALGGFARGKWY